MAYFDTQTANTIYDKIFSEKRLVCFFYSVRRFAGDKLGTAKTRTKIRY